MEQQQLAAAFKALGDPTRVKIYEQIRGKDDICACEILESLEISQPTLSHHIKQLCANNLITCRKEGRWVHYTANRETAASLAEWMRA